MEVLEWILAKASLVRLVQICAESTLIRAMWLGFEGEMPWAYLGKVDIRDDDDIHGAGRILGSVGGVALRVVAVFTLARLALPWHAGNGNGRFGC